MMPGSIRPHRLLQALLASSLLFAPALTAQQNVVETRDPRQQMDPEFAKFYREWTSDAKYGSPLVDHLPIVPGVPTPKDVLGYHIGAAQDADLLRRPAALLPRARGGDARACGSRPSDESDEDRELVVVWVSSRGQPRQAGAEPGQPGDHRGSARAGPTRRSRDVIRTTMPHYHLMGGLHSGETGPSEMLMELAYRLATETSPDHLQHPQQPDRVDHAGRRRRRARPERGLVLSQPRPQAGEPAGARRTPRRRQAARVHAGRGRAR